jgi:NitT/TauT family transport system substrate-binding protein
MRSFNKSDASFRSSGSENAIVFLSTHKLFRFFLSLFAVAALSAAAMVREASSQETSQPADRVTVGVQRSLTDAGLFLADANGFFAREGIVVQFVHLETTARTAALIARGELDAAGMEISAGLYNAVARGIDLRIVAAKAYTPPGRPLASLIVRKALVDSGRYRTLADLKGLTVGVVGHGGTSSVTLADVLRQTRLQPDDVHEIPMGIGQMTGAMAGGSLDAGFMFEPLASETQRLGIGMRVAGDDEFHPGRQMTAIVFAGSFAIRRPHVARAFLRAYLRGARLYADATRNGRLEGPDAYQIATVLARMANVRDANTIYGLSLPAVDPDGQLDLAKLKDDLAFYRDAGLIEGDVDVPLVIDKTFIEDTLRALGSYAPNESK